MSVRKTSVEIDFELLEAARHLLATPTVTETIDAGLREILRTEARLEEVEALSMMCGMDLADPEVMARARHS